MPLLTSLADNGLKAYGFAKLDGAGTSWFGLFASASNDRAGGLYVDSANDIITGSSTTYSTRVSGLAAKIASNGTSVTWQKAITDGSTTNDCIQLVANDTYVYLLGSNASSNGIISQLSNAGAMNWTKRVIGGAGVAVVRDGAIDTSGNVYITGNFYNDNQGQGTNPFVAKFNSSGTLQWSRGVDWGANGWGYGITVDSSANVYVAITLAGAGGYLMKINTSGTQQWAKSIYKSATDAFWAMDGDTSGNSHVFGQQTTPYYTFIGKFDSSGATTWQRTLSTQNYLDNTVGTIDSSGNTYVAFGDSAATVYIAKYNSSGTIQWQRSIAKTGGQLSLKGMAVDAAGQLVVSARTETTSHIFVMKVPVDGSKTGSYVVGGTTFVYAASSLTDAAGSASSANGGVNATPYATFVNAALTYTSNTTSLSLTKTSI